MIKSVCGLVLIASFAGGCQMATSPPSEATAPETKNVGTKKWIASYLAISICPTPALDAKSCRIVKSGSATVEAFERSTGPYLASYRVRLGDGGSGDGFISEMDFNIMDSDEEHKRKLAERKDCDRRGGVSVGMTAKQVEATCWGRPRTVNSTVTGSGERQQWVYPGYNYVYLTNGVVTSIQTSQ